MSQCRAAALEPAVAFDNRLGWRQVDLVIFANHLTRRILTKRQAAMLAMRRAMVLVGIGCLGQCAGMPLMPRLGTTGPRAFPLNLLVGRWRLL